MIALLGLATGCQRAPAAVREPARAGSVLADTALGGALPPAPIAPADSGAAVAVSPPSSGPQSPPPEAAPAEPPEPSGAVDRLAPDERFRPPVLLGPARVRLPERARGSVELELRVDERGVVTDATLASRGADPEFARAAIAAARALRFQPARLRGVPVAAWCRQRIDAGR